MESFREAFNISERHQNSSSSCASDDDVTTSALIVSYPCMFLMALNLQCKLYTKNNEYVHVHE